MPDEDIKTQKPGSINSRFSASFLRSRLSCVHDCLLCAHDDCLVSGSLQPPFHSCRLIQCGEGTHSDAVESPALAGHCWEILLEKLFLKPVRVRAVSESSCLHSVLRDPFGMFRTISGIIFLTCTVFDESVHLKGVEDALRDGKGDVIEVVVEDLIIRVRVDKADFHKDSGHAGAAQDDQPGAFFDSQVREPDCFELLVYVLRHLEFQPGLVVDKGFNTGISVGFRAGVAVEGYKKSTPASFASIAF